MNVYLSGRFFLNSSASSSTAVFLVPVTERKLTPRTAGIILAHMSGAPIDANAMRCDAKTRRQLYNKAQRRLARLSLPGSLCNVTGFRAGAGQAAAQIFQVDAIDSASALERLVKEWTVLWDRSECGTRFQHPERTLPRVRTLTRGAFLCALAMRLEGRLVAFAPMFHHRHAANASVRQISFIGAGTSDSVDILAEPEYSAEAAACVLQHLAGNRERWDICDFQELPENSALPQAAIPHGLTGAVLPSRDGNQRLLLWHPDSRLPSRDWPDTL